MTDANIGELAEKNKPALPADNSAAAQQLDRIKRAAAWGPKGVQKVVADSEDHMALIFAEVFGEELLYVPEWHTWMRFNRKCWKKVEEPHVWNCARAVVREFTTLAEEQGERKSYLQKISSQPTIVRVTSLARGDMLANADEFDAHPMDLNTPHGIVNLRTGKTQKAQWDDFCTKCTAVSPENREAPLWMKFLEDVTGGDPNLAWYLQKLAGYCLTGLTSEHVMAFCYGTGANGKSVFLNTLLGILGDYAKPAPVDTFTETRGERHPTDIARLQGARLVVAQETDEGRYWAEAKVKGLTGGDRISARFMRGNFFEYTPAFKLVVAGNHKPRLRNVDEAFRRRLHMVPFNVTIPAEDRDPELADKLQEEWPAILSWMIEGALDWQTIGLAPPEAVIDFSREYFAGQDPLADWLDAKTVRQAGAFTPHAHLYRSWQNWGLSHEQFEQMGPRRFIARMESHGLKTARKKSARGFLGIRLG